MYKEKEGNICSTVVMNGNSSVLQAKTFHSKEHWMTKYYVFIFNKVSKVKKDEQLLRSKHVVK